MAQSTSVLVADNHSAVVAAVSTLLEQHGFTVVGRAPNGAEALELALRARPDVAVVDTEMPKLTGLELVARLADDAPEVAVVLYTGRADRGLLTDALDAGARGVVLKEAPLSDVVRAVEAVRAGGTYVDAVLAGLLVQVRGDDGPPELTRRERDVLRLLADGLANDEIGRRLHISGETVRTHIRKAMMKLDAETRTEAVAKALRRAIIS